MQTIESNKGSLSKFIESIDVLKSFKTIESNKGSVSKFMEPIASMDVLK